MAKVPSKHSPTFKLEMVIDGIVYYSHFHTDLAIQWKIQQIQRYRLKKCPELPYEIAIYRKSSFAVRHHVNKLSPQQQQEAINLLELYPARTVARRYNVDKTTILRYKKNFNKL